MKNFRMIKVLLTSRHLFSNWLSAGVRYFLMKRGLVKGGYVAVKCNGRVYMLKSKTYGAIVYAYYRKAFEFLECSDNIYAVVSYGGWKIRFYDSFEFLYDIVYENLVGGAYDDLDVVNATVVDVGTGVGDTAILFALRGARRVIALEPYPSLYRRALVNIRVNGVEDRVILVNAALGSFDGEVCAEARDVNGYYLFSPSSRCDVRVRMYTLRSLIKEFGVEENSALKMDCEGCEYETVLHADSRDLKVFKEIVIEYHNGYRELKKLLENLGFDAKIKPIRSSPQPIEKQGYIVAKRSTK
jgi:FkbM family methyltransferase